jgi:galactokinase
VNLIGEHTDYNEGYVLPVAIDLSCWVAGRRRDDGRLRLVSAQLGPAEASATPTGESVTGWAAYVAGTAWALGLEHGADLFVDSDVPAGAGLSSSAALECAAGLALASLAGVGVDPTDLALAGQRAENQVVGAPVGVMDQMASVHGAAGSALFLDCRTLEHRQVPLPGGDLQLVVVDTRVAHAHATGGYAERRRDCESAAEVLGVAALRDATLEQVDAAAGRLGERRARRGRHVVTENDRVLATVAALEASDPGALGPLFAASHASLRDDFEVSCAELDLAVSAANGAGAVAARMTGGGFGGSAVALVPAAQVADVTSACRAAAAQAGAPEPVVRVVRSADAARRVD